MCTGLEIAAITAVTAASAYQVNESKEARRSAIEQTTNQSADAKRAQDDLVRQQAASESTQAADATRRSARRRQLSLATGGQGRGSTILTEGLGTVGAPQAAAKTLLGS